MCTVTVVRAGELLRVACNRDERRDRLRAHPPFIGRAGNMLVVAPQDAQARGTWIAANSAGIVFALLNVSADGDPSPAPELSRGVVIPVLVGAATLENVASAIESVPFARCRPFRLLAMDSSRVVEFAAFPGSRTLRSNIHFVDRPLLFTSSSLGDARVEGPRRALFEEVWSSPTPGTHAAIARQDMFHRHRWRDRPALSVHMSRPDACTVSTTTVEVTPRDVRMIYEVAHGAPGTPVGLLIERQHAGHISAHRTGREHAAV